jgi:hypothetical protein
MTDTVNLGLPCIEASQAQKHVTHNEALRLLDTLVQLAVLDRDLAAPPGSPTEGQRWIVKAAATGAWDGHDDQIAAWQDGAWQFSAPRTGWLAYVVDEGALLAWTGSAWVDAISAITSLNNMVLLGVGTMADGGNPFSAKLNNTLWVAKTVAEGGSGDLRHKLSKESAANTLSFLFQDNLSGRAEIGLTGDDDLHVKVSADGSAWTEALLIDRATGKLSLAQGFASPATVRGQLASAPIDALGCTGLQINGGMLVDQEHAGGVVTLTAGGSLQTAYLLDAVMAAYRGTFVATAQQVSDAPSGYAKSLKFSVTTAQGSLGANDELTVVVPVEGPRCVRLGFGTAGATAISFAFWVKAHRTGTYSGALKNKNVGGSSPRSYPFTFTVNSADTWEYKTVTVATGDTSGSWATAAAAAGLYLAIAIAAGSSRAGAANAWAGSDYSAASGTTNGVAATSDVFQLTGLVVLPGIELPDSSRAPYLMRPFDEALTLCQRFYEKSYDYGVVPGSVSNNGFTAFKGTFANNVSAVLLTAEFKQRKPSVVNPIWYSPNSGASGKSYNATGGVDVTATAFTLGETRTTATAGITGTTSPDVRAHWVADARLP